MSDRLRGVGIFETVAVSLVLFQLEVLTDTIGSLGNCHMLSRE